MWQAKINSSSYAGGRLVVNVIYDDLATERSVTEEIDLTGGTIEALHRKVQSRLDILTQTDELNAQIVTGPFTPVIPEPTATQKLEVALNKVERLKRIKDAGILPNTTPKETIEAQIEDAKAEATAAFNELNP